MPTTKIRSSQQIVIDNNLNLNSNRIINLSEPQLPTDAVTKQYVDNYVQGLKFKEPCRVASTTNITFTDTDTISVNSIDGITLISGDRVLLKNQTNQKENGIYIYNQSGSIKQLLRAPDFNNWNEIPSAFVFIQEGNINADTAWVCVSDAGGSIGLTDITWIQFSSAGSLIFTSGIIKNGNIISLNIEPSSALSINANNQIKLNIDSQSLVINNNILSVNSQNLFNFSKYQKLKYIVVDEINYPPITGSIDPSGSLETTKFYDNVYKIFSTSSYSYITQSNLIIEGIINPNAYLISLPFKILKINNEMPLIEFYLNGVLLSYGINGDYEIVFGTLNDIIQLNSNVNLKKDDIIIINTYKD